MSKNDWKKGKAESAMIEYEKKQMQKFADEFRKKRAEEKKITMETYDDKEDINWTKYKIVVPTEADKKV